MPQTPIGLNALTPAGTFAPTKLDTQNALQVTSGGISSALNLAAGARVVKASPGRICTLVITTVGTAGTLAVNDAATTGAAATSNLIYSAANTLAAGTVVNLSFPCLVGIVVTVPTGGNISVSFT
jgi:hypothetical protein